MVLEEFFKADWVDKRPVYSLFLGAFFTLVSFATSLFIFRSTPNFIGISTLLFTVILIVPAINKLFDIEERIESKENLSFFQKHEHIIDFFVYFFIGVFIVLFVIALIKPGLVFSEQQLYNIEAQQAPQAQEGRKLPPPPETGSSLKQAERLLRNNLYVMVISFALSLFYGSGAMFLIILNASAFASALARVVRSSLPGIDFLTVYSYILCNLGIMFFHTIPETAGYLIAAISGGVLSHAFMREKIGGKNFRIVVKDAFILLIISYLVLLAAAAVEIELSKKLFSSDVCAAGKIVIIVLFFLIIGAIVLFELMRKKKMFK
ncbi:hypothetical protein HYX05_02910 [Candidatus Woesearchaeota archaeon]|nr:hypothetical protein [Candidatus Woesearchaeota archaeon]